MSFSSVDFVPENVGSIKAASLREVLARTKPVQGVFVCLPKPLAGMGTKRQLQGIVSGLDDICAERDLVAGYIGPPMEGFGQALGEPYAEVEDAKTVADSYKKVVAAFERAFQRMAYEGVDRIAVLCMGYTAYGPESVKRAIRRFEEKTGQAAPKHITVCVIDSAYPDTNKDERALDEDGWPTSRFYTPAFERDRRIETIFLLTSAYNFNVSLLNARAPFGLGGASVVFPPYTDNYLTELTTNSQQGRSSGLGKVAEQLPGVNQRKEDDLLVPLVSSDIWSEDAVDVWMTPAEHQTCVEGTKAVVRALTIVSERIGKRIWLPIDTTGAELIEKMGLKEVAVMGPGQTDCGKARVLVSPYRGLSQDDHTRMLGSADLAISRTGGQANATVVLTFAKTPNLVIDMPSAGYMQSELTSLFMTHNVEVSEKGNVVTTPKEKPLAWRARWHFKADKLAGLIEEALTNESERQSRTEAALVSFLELKGSSTGNVFTIIKQLIGN